MRPLPMDLGNTKVQKRLLIHINFGGGRGTANYRYWWTPEGSTEMEPLPITYQYDTRLKDAGQTGFFLDGVDRCFKRMADLLDYWPTLLADRAAAKSEDQL